MGQSSPDDHERAKELAAEASTRPAGVAKAVSEEGLLDVNELETRVYAAQALAEAAETEPDAVLRLTEDLQKLLDDQVAVRSNAERALRALAHHVCSQCEATLDRAESLATGGKIDAAWDTMDEASEQFDRVKELVEGTTAAESVLDETIGVQIVGESGNQQFMPLLDPGTDLPAAENWRFTTNIDNQKSVEMSVLQSSEEVPYSRLVSSEDEVVASLNFDGLPPAPANLPELEVQLHIDENGVITAAVSDHGTGNRTERQVGTAAVRRDTEVHILHDSRVEALGERLNEVEDRIEAVQQPSETIPAIDFGTNNIRCGVLEDGQPTVVPCGSDGWAMPSVVSVTEDGRILTGEAAANRATLHPDSTQDDVLGTLGREDAVELNGQEYIPEGLAAVLLQDVKRDIDEYLDADIEDVVLTVPASFDYRQRRAVKNAAEIAGLGVRRIIPTPVAASMAHGLDRQSDQTVLVCDLGGGNLDTGVVDIGGGVYEVLSTNGDRNLGGDDYDRAVVDQLLESFADEHGVNLDEDSSVRRRVKEAVADAKVEFANHDRIEVFVPNLAKTDAGQVDLQRMLTREMFDEITAHLSDRIERVVEQVIADSGHETEDIDHLVLAGGATRLPTVRERIVNLTGREPERTVTPREAPPLGGAVQGGILTDEIDDLLLLDVTQLAIGVESRDGQFERLIEKNTTIPTEESKVFTTTADNQTSVQVRVFQGEHELAAENELLTDFVLEDLPPEPAGELLIRVDLRVDHQGVVDIEIHEQKSGLRREITVTSSIGLDEGRLEAMYSALNWHRSFLDAIKHPGSRIRDERNTQVAKSTETAIRVVDSEDIADEPEGEPAGEQSVRTDDLQPGAADDPTEAEIEQILEAYDDLTRAVEADSDDPSAIRKGIEMTDWKLKRAEAGGQLIKAVRDALALVYKNSSEDVEVIRDSAADAIDRVNELLADAGIEVVDPDPGEPAEADRHRVVEQAPANLQEGHVIEVEQTGFVRNDTVRRPATVRVSDGTQAARTGSVENEATSAGPSPDDDMSTVLDADDEPDGEN